MKLAQEKQLKEELLRKRLIFDYKSVAKSKLIQKEFKIWDESLNDVWKK